MYIKCTRHINIQYSEHASIYMHKAIRALQAHSFHSIISRHRLTQSKQFSQNPDSECNRLWLHAMTMMNQCALASCWYYSEFQGFKLPWSRLYSLQQYTIIVASTLLFICCCDGRKRLWHCSTQVIKRPSNSQRSVLKPQMQSCPQSIA
jgi:hypothetical protein